MDIKIKTAKETAKDSTYILGTARKARNYRAASATLYEEEHCKDIDEAHAMLERAFSAHHANEASSMSEGERKTRNDSILNGMWKLVKVCPPAGRRLSDEAVALLKQYMGWTADSRGNYQWFYRMLHEGRVWDTCIAPIPAMTDHSQGRYAKFQKEWFKLQTENKVKAWTVFDQEISELSPMIDDAKLAEIALMQLSPEERPDVSRESLELFQIWAERDFDPKREPIPADIDSGGSRVEMLESLRMIFDPQSPTAWVTNLMKEDTQRMQIPMPETISNDKEQDAFTYVDIQGLSNGPTPSWDKWIQSVHEDCREIFMAAVFAPMHDKCRHRKLVWMRSQGYDGKSTFFNALNRWSGGKLTRAFGGHNINSDFGLEGLIGARILIWGDSQHEHALSTNAVHSITGGDVVTINRKNEKAIQYRFNSMLFVASNSRPQLKTWARNETTRLLYIPFIEPDEEVLKEFAIVDETTGKVKRQSDGTPIFKGSNLEEELIAEMPHILWKCAKMYQKFCPPPFRDLLIPEKVYDLMLEENEHEDGNEFASFVRKFVHIDPEAKVTTKALHDKLKKARPGTNNNSLGEFHRFMEKYYNVEKKKLGRKGHQEMHYTGIRLKEGDEPATMFEGK